MKDRNSVWLKNLDHNGKNNIKINEIERLLILTIFIFLFSRTVVIIHLPCLGLSGRSFDPTSASLLESSFDSVSIASSMMNT